MPKQLSAVAVFALAVMVFLIWQDPSGTADVIESFFSQIFDMTGELWDRLGEFFGSFGE